MAASSPASCKRRLERDAQSEEEFEAIWASKSPVSTAGALDGHEPSLSPEHPHPCEIVPINVRRSMQYDSESEASSSESPGSRARHRSRDLPPVPGITSGAEGIQRRASLSRRFIPIFTVLVFLCCISGICAVPVHMHSTDRNRSLAVPAS